MTGSLRRGASVFALAVVVPAACSPTDREPAAGQFSAAQPALRFETLEPAETGLDVTMTFGTDPSTQIIEVNGGGLPPIALYPVGDHALRINWRSPQSVTETDRLFTDGRSRFIVKADEHAGQVLNHRIS